MSAGLRGVDEGDGAMSDRGEGGGTRNGGNYYHKTSLGCTGVTCDRSGSRQVAGVDEERFKRKSRSWWWWWFRAHEG